MSDRSKGQTREPETVPEHNFGNDYCDYYVHKGTFPQTFVCNIQDPLVGYPKLQRLHELKDLHNRRHASPPQGRRVERGQMTSELSKWAAMGLNFDVVLIGGCIDMATSYEDLVQMPVPQLTPRPSILLIWVPDSGLDAARAVFEAWGFRRSEDIVYACKSSGSLHMPKGMALAENEVVTKSTWHCLLGLKGTLRRSEDPDLINCNVDTDLIIEQATERPSVIPEQIYRIVENFTSMSRRVHIVPAYSPANKPVRMRPGWVVVSPDVMVDNFDPLKYMEDTRARGTRVPMDAEIDSLRPKTPPKMRRRN